MTELPNSVKVSSIDKSFTKYKNNLLSSNENSRNQKNEIEHHKELFFEYLLFHTYLFYKKHNYLQEFGNKKYESIPLDYKNIDSNLRLTEANLLENYSDYYIERWEKKFFISAPMFNFCLDFIQNKFFDIPQSFESKIDELTHQLPDNNAKKELNDITKETMRRIEASKGFNKLVKLSDNNIKRFHTLIQISIAQFYNKLPTDNPVYDRVLKNALNVVEPGIASGYNKQVAKAVESAKKEFNVKFSYEPFNASDNVYPLYSIDLIPKEYETNTERRIEKILEVLETIKIREFKKEGWRPFTSKTLVLFLRNSALVLGGYVFIFELKTALKKFLNRGTNNIPLDKLVSRYAYSAEGQALDILDYQETNLFSGEQIEFDNYEIKFNEFIFPIFNSTNISTKDILRYSVLLKEQLNTTKPESNQLNIDEEIEFFSIELNEMVIQENSAIINLHKKFRSFVNRLDEPVYLEGGIEIILDLYFNFCKSIEN